MLPVLSANYACMFDSKYPMSVTDCFFNWSIFKPVMILLFFSNEVLIEVGKLLILYVMDLALGYQYIKSGPVLQ